MMEIGKIQKLKVIKEKDFGIYLSDGDKADAQGVLLPKKQVPEGTKIGDELEVFLYKDSEDRLIATTSKLRTGRNPGTDCPLSGKPPAHTRRPSHRSSPGPSIY